MIRIDSDTHFTPFAHAQGLRVVKLPTAAAAVRRSHNRAIGRILKKYPGKFIGIAAVHGVDSGPLLGVERFARYNFGSRRLMIGGDYPHSAGTSPNTIALLKARAGLMPQDVDNLLGGAAAEFSAWPRRCKKIYAPARTARFVTAVIA